MEWKTRRQWRKRVEYADVVTGVGFPWKFSLFLSGFTSINPQVVIVKRESQLERMFRRPTTKPFDFPKKHLPCWSPALYSAGKTRKNGNVEKLSALVYDFDATDSVPGVIAARLRKENRAFALYTTWSHTKAKPRFRLVLFTNRPILPHEFSQVWENGLSLIRYVTGVDRQCNDLARHYALPVRRVGAEEFVGEYEPNGSPIDVDALASFQAAGGKRGESGKFELREETVLALDAGATLPTKDVIEKGEGKYRCTCPFQKDASPGSAFLRVMGDKRSFLQCTSSRHDHDGTQFWLKKTGAANKKGKRAAPRSVEVRTKLLTELPERLIEYAEKKLTYCSPQGVFYRRQQGEWEITQPLKKDTLVDHLVGLLPPNGDGRHAHAIVDHILSRQTYGFECASDAGPIIWTDRGRMINLYSQPKMKRVRGEWPRISRLINTLAGNDSKVREWLLHWSAALIQHPERRSMVAVIAISPKQGIGKSMYGRMLAEMIGAGNVSVVSNRALRDRFNSSYVTSLLVLADEVGMDPRMSDVVSELKGYITDEEIHCATPYAARMKVTNRMSWWMTSNNRRPLVLDKNDRRITVLAVASPTPDYLQMLRSCFDSRLGTFEPEFRDEMSSYAFFLKNLRVDWKLISNPLDTEARRRVQSASKSSIDSFVDEIQKMGIVSVMETYKPRIAMRLSDAILENCIPCDRLYGSYREWCEAKGYQDVCPEAEIALAITSLPGVEKRNVRIAGTRIRAYIGLSQRKPVGSVVQFPGGEH